MKTLIVIDQPPYGSLLGRELMDMAFSLSAFDRRVDILFAGAGVNWLRDNHQPELLQQKNAAKNLSAAQIFGVERLLASTADLKRFQIDPGQLKYQVELVSEPVDNAYDHVVRL
ncbi:MAG: DsrE family protein [Marinobacter sp.]|nr:DsrE family protein [Marinobacter sp.]